MTSRDPRIRVFVLPLSTLLAADILRIQRGSLQRERETEGDEISAGTIALPEVEGAFKMLSIDRFRFMHSHVISSNPWQMFGLHIEDQI